MYKRVKDQCAWQLEQGRELSALKEKVDKARDIEVANRVLDNQTAMGLSSLDGRVGVLERQGEFLLDRQEQDNNAWTNVSYRLKTDMEELEEHFNTRLDLLRRSQQSLCRNFNEARREVGDTGGEGLWKQVFTCWEHFSLWQKVPPM